MHLWFLFAAKHPYSLLYRISSSKPVRLHDHQWWIDVELVVPPDWPAEVQSCFQGRVWGTWGLKKTPAIKSGASFLIPCLLVASCIIIPARFSKIAVVWIAASMLFGYLQYDLRIPFERGWNLSDVLLRYYRNKRPYSLHNSEVGTLVMVLVRDCPQITKVYGFWNHDIIDKSP